jgi:hypothetical protein
VVLYLDFNRIPQETIKISEIRKIIKVYLIENDIVKFEKKDSKCHENKTKITDFRVFEMYEIRAKKPKFDVLCKNSLYSFYCLIRIFHYVLDISINIISFHVIAKRRGKPIFDGRLIHDLN